MGQRALVAINQASLAAAKKLAAGLSSLKSWTIVAAGTGYVVGELVAVSGGTALSSYTARLRVAEVSPGGIITRLDIERSGSYSAKPANDAATTSDKAGTGLTLTLVWNDDAPPAEATHCIIQCLTQAVTVRSDGTAPTAAVGTRLPVGTTMQVSGAEMRTMQAIEQAASATLFVQFFKS